MKSIFLFLAYSCIILSSCKKSEDQSDIIEPEKSAKIGNITILGLDDVRVEGSEENIELKEISKKGFCWSVHPEPTKADNYHEIPRTAEFVDTIQQVGQFGKFYFRSFVETAYDTIYSETLIASTGGIKVITDKVLIPNSYNWILNAIESDHDTFVVLTGNSKEYQYPEDYSSSLSEIDKDGQVKWTYNTPSLAQNYATSTLTQLSDGYAFVTRELTTSGTQIVVTKVGLTGKFIWRKSFSEKPFQEFIKTKLSSSGQLVLSISTSDNITNGVRENYKIQEIVVDEDGNAVAEKTFRYNSLYPNSDMSYLVREKKNGFFSANVKESNPIPTLLAQSFNEDYSIKWEYAADDIPDCISKDLITTSEGNPIFLTSQGIDRQTLLFAFDDNSGSLLWKKYYPRDFYNANWTSEPLCMSPILQKSYHICGGGDRFFIVRLDEKNNVYWEFFPETEDRDFAYQDVNKIFINDEKYIYLLGTKFSEANDRQTQVTFKKLEVTYEGNPRYSSSDY